MAFHFTYKLCISFCSVNQCVSGILGFHLVCLNLQMSAEVMCTSGEFFEL